MEILTRLPLSLLARSKSDRLLGRGFHHNPRMLMAKPSPLVCSSIILAITCLGPARVMSQDQAHLALESPFASFVQDDFPFFTQTLDARTFGDAAESTNLTPRAIIFPLENGWNAAFDPDLLRWALIWRSNDQGEYLKMDGMAPGSYRLPERKSQAGQGELPKLIGIPVLASDCLPGCWAGKQPPTQDPRDRGVAQDGELSLGPIPAEIARFSGLRLIGDRAQLEYQVGSAVVAERIEVADGAVRRTILVSPHPDTIWLRSGKQWHELAPSDREQVLQINMKDSAALAQQDRNASNWPEAVPPTRRWTDAPTTVTTLPKDAATAAFVRDDFPLPVPNPWKRNVRLSGLDFFPDGRAAFCTFDGDVWIVSGFDDKAGAAERLTWTRYASGLHEPQSLAIVDEQIYVFDRNGIVRLHDEDGNGEADWHENFSNVVAQTAETREFPMDMLAIPGGGFYLSKGGQIGTTWGKWNGDILRLDADGRSFSVVATGMRQPYLGLDPTDGTLTASDQQGNWRPATPIYRITPGSYFGFQPEPLKDKVTHPAPIGAPEVLIPHFINQSAAGQLWVKSLPGAEAPHMGELDGCLLHLGYNRPELFRAYLGKLPGQGAVVPVMTGFPTGLLKGKLNPVDGRVYLAGFKIWGTSGERISGLFRIRPGDALSLLPRDLLAEKRGVMLSFSQALDPALAGELGRYAVDRWNYRQTHDYGSGNYKLGGEPGQESIPVASARLSEDQKSLFLGIIGMAPSDTLRITYRLPRAEVTTVDSAYLTVTLLPDFDLKEMGFSDNEVDLTPPPLSLTEAAVTPTPDLGREVALRYGCVACHQTGDPSLPAPPAPVAGAAGAAVAVGPPWIGLWGSKRVFTDKSEIKSADEAYIRESILDPPRRVAAGFEMERSGVGMPSYLGVLKEHEITAIVLYIESLEKKTPK